MKTLLPLLALLSGCALFPPEHVQSAKVVIDHATPATRAAHADLNSGELAAAIAAARK